MSRVALDPIKGIAVAQTNRAELQPWRNCCTSKIRRIYHNRLRYACDGVVGREGLELFPLGDYARSIFERRFPRAFRRGGS